MNYTTLQLILVICALHMPVQLFAAAKRCNKGLDLVKAIAENVERSNIRHPYVASTCN